MFPELAPRIKFCENERLVPSIATQGIRQVELEDLAIWQRLQQELYYEVVWLVWLGGYFVTVSHNAPRHAVSQISVPVLRPPGYFPEFRHLGFREFDLHLR